MKFINHIMMRVTLYLSIIIAVWAVLFYYIIVDEVNDETDDVLEDYSAMIIQNFLAGEQMPSNDNGSNNTYYLRSVDIDSLSIVKQREGFSNKNIYIQYKKEDEPARILRQVFRDADNNYYEVTVITPTIDSSDLIGAIWKSLVILFVMLLVIILLINGWAIKVGLNPLDMFLKWLHNSNIETCELPQTNHSNITEIKELSEAIKAFANRGQRAFIEQKEFIGNASHELQTPIAICQNRLELLCQSDLSEDQLKDVAECLSTLSRLSKLNRSLLMLSKIENGGFEKELVSINKVVHQNLESLRELYSCRNITLNLIESGECYVEANSELISTLILNLLKNSYSHNIDGGRVEVQICSNYLLISNSGVEKPLDKQKIFNRFYRGGSRSGTYGLGLSITLSICKLYSCKIDYWFDEKLHNFKIIFR